jgi:hypothetical protein
MTVTSQVLKREMDDLVLEQVIVFKEATDLRDRQLLEYHLRHFRIMTLYRELDKIGWEHERGSAVTLQQPR